jgi:16S rRNA (cytosine967-C5)-methyltransferase
MGDRGKIIACDFFPRKLLLIEENALRLGISIITTMALDAANTEPADALAKTGGKRFDRILADAPCSGLGVLRRNPDGKWWKKAEDITDMAARQKRILLNSTGLLKEGGTILYATCSTSREENEDVIADFLSKRPGFMLEDLREDFPEYAELFTDSGCFRGWPHRHAMDGFFAARLREKS